MVDNFMEEAQPEDWLTDLPSYQSRTIKELLQSGLSYEEAAAAWVGQIGAGTNAPFGTATAGPGLFENLKKEFNKLICGDPEYDKVRRDAATTWNKYKSGVTMTIAAAVGAVLGVAAVVLVPAIALLLAAASKVGLNAWCATQADTEKGDTDVASG
jgi:hypothetical protein